ncbi:MAG TPA: hypothetical protein VLT33_47675 [Labilithrix sp.]|nr:hypothetical protein [Labilithrix sp.]
MIPRIAVLSLLGLVLTVAAGCSAPSEDDGTLADEAGDELRSTGVTKLTVGRSTGFSPPPPAGSCRPSGQWTADLAARTIAGQACIGAHPKAVDRALTAHEVALIRAALAGVRTAARPARCPTDAPVASLELERGPKTFFYVEQRSACGGGTAVTSASIGALIDVMEGLTSAP